MLSFNEIFADSTKYCKKIKTDEYHETGKNMIVDQGQSEIAGYTDLEEGLFSFLKNKSSVTSECSEMTLLFPK